jgi:hypothetical protein
MKRAGVKVGVGTNFSYDGQIVQVIEIHTVDGDVDVLGRDLRSQTVHRFALSELMLSERACRFQFCVADSSLKWQKMADPPQ